MLQEWLLLLEIRQKRMAGLVAIAAADVCVV
jgi:hypothetical protein